MFVEPCADSARIAFLCLAVLQVLILLKDVGDRGALPDETLAGLVEILEYSFEE